MVDNWDSLPENRRKVLQAIKTYRRKFGASPSIRDIQESVGYSSPGSVHYLLKDLVTDGYLDQVEDGQQQRNYRIPGDRIVFPEVGWSRAVWQLAEEIVDQLDDGQVLSDDAETITAMLMIALKRMDIDVVESLVFVPPDGR